VTLRSRFAPSPTGLLHIGNARSAVINWAYALSHSGEFILRIDDTDLERSKKEFEDSIKNDLNWLGLKWSKTFKQSERLKKYYEKIDYLKKINRLYPCFETAEELSLKRKSLLAAGKPPIYDRKSLQLSDLEIKENIKRGKNPHWRLKLENKIIKWNDLIKNQLSFDCSKLSDPILIREDNTLLYHLPSVIDDIEEKITDVIRGEDHITNTAFHIQLFEALGAKIPKFGHHPLLTDDMGHGFAKRLGSVSLQNLKNEGYENITLLNYLLSIGTSKNLSKEKNIENLYQNFDLKILAKSSPKFSKKILTDLNKDILQSLNFSEIKNKFSDYNLSNANENFWFFVKNNINFFHEIKKWWKIIYSDNSYSSADHDFLNIAAQLLPNDPFDNFTWEKWTSEINKKTGRSGKNLYMPLRLALTGENKGPELRFLMPLLNKQQVLKKLSIKQ
tara:strand:- start:4492 stop:5829 length:1338 start_codon:yes stop_codon:yes gene_type:complete